MKEEIERGVSAPPKISVIVPVYNAEKYLHRCIDSILSQTFTDFELLLIDDGSKDKSGAICDEYAAKDSRVRVFHKENGGVSSARNLGLDYANSEWIAFVDADDSVLPNWLSIFIDNCTESDLVVQGFMTDKSNIVAGINYNGHVSKGFYLLAQHEIAGYLFVKLFRYDIIHKYHLRFNENFIFREDEDFVLKYLNRINHMVCLREGGYIYNLPNFDKKYLAADNFYCYCSIFLSMKQLMGSQFDECSKGYLDELTKALFLSYATKKDDRCERLAVYQQVVGKYVICSQLNFWSKFILFIMHCPKIVSYFFDFKISVNRHNL